MISAKYPQDSLARRLKRKSVPGTCRGADMSTRLWIGFVALLTTLTWMAPATANAQARQRYPSDYGQSSRAGYDNGYREGLVSGERDGRAGRTFDYQRDRVYQRADSGYLGYGNRGDYQSSFRQGYAQGYRIGYERTGRYESRGSNRYPGYPGGYGYPGEPR